MLTCLEYTVTFLFQPMTTTATTSTTTTTCIPRGRRVHFGWLAAPPVPTVMLK